MQRVNQLRCVLVGLVVAALVPHPVLAQAVGCQPQPCVQVKTVRVPASVSVGQPLTVNITVGYAIWGVSGGGLEFPQLLVEILDQFQNGKPLPLAGSTPSYANSCQFPVSPPGETVCYARAFKLGEGDFTVSYMLTAPSHTGTWYLYVFGVLGQSKGALSSASDFQAILSNVKSEQVKVAPSSVFAASSSNLTSTVTTTILPSSITSTSVTPNYTCCSNIVAAGSTRTSSPVLPVSRIQYILVIVALGVVAASFCWSLISGRRRTKPTAAKGRQFCFSCGAQLPPESKFCNRCGSAQT